MKTSQAILSLLAAPAMCLTAMAQETVNVLEVLPTEGFMPGRAIRPQTDEALMPLLVKIEEKFQALSEEEKKAMLEKRKDGRALEYNPKLWDSKADYDTYLKVWKNTKIVEAENVVIGLRASSSPDVWDVVSATVANGQTLPLTLGALTYNAKTNIWKSNNGELTASPVTETDTYIYGAQSGQEWKLEKDDALSSIRESVRITKTADGNFTFVYYNFTEISKASGQVIAQGGYVLRFPKKTANASVTRPGQR